MRTLRLHAVEFLRRFLMHVLPKGFVRIRRYGLLANARRSQNLARCRELLGDQAPPEPSDLAPSSQDPATDTPERHETRLRCPACNEGRMLRVAVILPGEEDPLRRPYRPP